MRRAEVIGRLAAKPTVGLAAVDLAAVDLAAAEWGVSRRSAVMVTAGVLIELAGGYIGDHTTTGETSYPPQQQTDGARISNHALPAAPVTVTRIAEATADDPYLAVHYLYRAIANGSATGCAVFSPTAAMQFATHFDASDRSTATTRLSEKVTNPINYAQTGTRSPDIYPDDPMTTSSCEIGPEGGLLLGRFTLHRNEQSKWYISAHETEECQVLTTALSQPDGRRDDDRSE